MSLVYYMNQTKKTRKEKQNKKKQKKAENSYSNLSDTSEKGRETMVGKELNRQKIYRNYQQINS